MLKEVVLLLLCFPGMATTFRHATTKMVRHSQVYTSTCRNARFLCQCSGLFVLPWVLHGTKSRNISRIRKYLNQSAAEQIIHVYAFVTSRLDNRNALFYGLPQNQISRLQHIQNTAARVVTLSRKSCHITPILKELHWLPVSQRIVFKLVLIVHKSVNPTLLQFIFLNCLRSIGLLLHAICAPATCHS